MILPIIVVIISAYYFACAAGRSQIAYYDVGETYKVVGACPSFGKTFFPTPYLMHSYVQSALAERPIDSTETSYEYMLAKVYSPDGGYTCVCKPALSKTKEIADRYDDLSNIIEGDKLAIILPGITGTHKSPYVNAFVHSLLNKGINCVVYLPRQNCSEFIAPKGLDTLEDLEYTMEKIKSYLNPNCKISIIGISLGACLLVNYMAKHDDLVCGVSLSNPINLSSLEVKIDNTIVNTMLVNRLKKIIKRNRKSLESSQIGKTINFDEILSIEKLKDFTQEFTCKTHKKGGKFFETVEKFNEEMGCTNEIEQVKNPLLVVASKDDPLVEKGVYPKGTFNNKNIIFIETGFGGHQGWITGFFKLKRWVVDPVTEYVTYYLNK